MLHFSMSALSTTSMVGRSSYTLRSSDDPDSNNFYFMCMANDVLCKVKPYLYRRTNVLIPHINSYTSSFYRMKM